MDVENDEITVINYFYDKQTDSYEIDSRTIEITVPNLVLEWCDLKKYDTDTGAIEVSKDLFDDFVKDSYVKILFTDSDTIYIYSMKYETEDVIGMNFVKAID